MKGATKPRADRLRDAASPDAQRCARPRRRRRPRRPRRRGGSRRARADALEAAEHGGRARALAAYRRNDGDPAAIAAAPRRLEFTSRKTARAGCALAGGRPARRRRQRGSAARARRARGLRRRARWRRAAARGRGRAGAGRRAAGAPRRRGGAGDAASARDLLLRRAPPPQRRSRRRRPAGTPPPSARPCASGN